MDYSIEALIAEGTGLKTKDETNYTSSSESAYDGYFDAVQAELTRSFENLEFLDTYSRVNEANDSAKLRMMKRLKRVYGSTIEDPAKASSVESFLNNNIRSLEEDKKTDGSTKKEPGKVRAFFERIVEALKRMLTGLKDFFAGIWKKIKEFFTRKNENNSRVATAEEIKKIVMGDGKGIKDIDHKDYNASNTKVASVGANDITIYMVKFDKINPSSIKSALENILKTSEISKITNYLKGNGANLNRSIGQGSGWKGYKDGERPQSGALDKVNAMSKTASDVEKLNDKDIIRVYYKTDAATPEYISKLTVRQIVASIKAISSLEEYANKTESVVEKGIKGVEEYIKAANGAGKDEATVNKCSQALRSAAKSSQKICSVGVKIAQTAYKLLLPKTDAEKNDYQSSKTADKLMKKTA